MPTVADLLGQAVTRNGWQAVACADAESRNPEAVSALLAQFP